MKIACVGQCVWDINIVLEEPYEENKKYVIAKPKENPGGPAFNASCLCAMWGNETSLYTHIGNDIYGKRIKAILDDTGIDDSGSVRNDATAVSYLIHQKGSAKRTILNYPGVVDEALMLNDVPKVDVILYDAHEPVMFWQLRKENKQAITIIDAGNLRDSILEAAHDIDHFICSQDFAQQYTKQNMNMRNMLENVSIFHQIASLHKGTTILTMGEYGLLYNIGDVIYHKPAYRMKSIDTSGAGDIFHGAYAWCCAHEMSLSDTLDIAAVAAALSTTKMGTMPSIPAYEDVIKALAVYKNKRNEKDTALT